MNSARVAGGAAPAPLHSTWPEPQSPVAQVPWPEPSKLQPVRPQNRPDQPVGAWREREVPCGSSNPVVSRTELPALDSIPGQTVYSQLFENVNVAPETSALERKDLQRIQRCPDGQMAGMFGA